MPVKPLRRFSLGLAVFFVLGSGLACNLFSGRAIPETPVPVPVTTEAVESLQSTLERSMNEYQQTGVLRLSIDESQLTSVVAMEIGEQSDPILRDAQIHLQQGQITITGEVNQGSVSLPAEIILLPGVSISGSPQFELVSAKLGPLPVPQALLDSITGTVNELIEDQISQIGVDLRLESIIIEDGVMLIQGSRR